MNVVRDQVGGRASILSVCLPVVCLRVLSWKRWPMYHVKCQHDHARHTTPSHRPLSIFTFPPNPFPSKP